MWKLFKNIWENQCKNSHNHSKGRLGWPFRVFWVFPDGSDGKESACNTGDIGSIPGSGRFPGEKGMATHSSILPGEFHGQRSLEGYSPGDHKKSEMTEQLSPSPSEFSKLRFACQAFFFSHQLFIGWGLPQGGSITLEKAASFYQGQCTKRNTAECPYHCYSSM